MRSRRQTCGGSPFACVLFQSPYLYPFCPLLPVDRRQGLCAVVRGRGGGGRGADGGGAVAGGAARGHRATCPGGDECPVADGDAAPGPGRYDAMRGGAGQGQRPSLHSPAPPRPLRRRHRRPKNPLTPVCTLILNDASASVRLEGEHLVVHSHAAPSTTSRLPLASPKNTAFSPLPPHSSNNPLARKYLLCYSPINRKGRKVIATGDGRCLKSREVAVGWGLATRAGMASVFLPAAEPVVAGLMGV